MMILTIFHLQLMCLVLSISIWSYISQLSTIIIQSKYYHNYYYHYHYCYYQYCSIPGYCSSWVSIHHHISLKIDFKNTLRERYIIIFNNINNVNITIIATWDVEFIHFHFIFFFNNNNNNNNMWWEWSKSIKYRFI